MVEAEILRKDIILYKVAVCATAEQSGEMMDEARFEEFYKELARPLWSYIYRVCGNAALADDLLHDTFCRFLCSKGTEISEQEMKPYIYKIATNLIHDHWRQSKREIQLLPDFDKPENPAKSDDLNHDMARVLQKLKPQEHTLLWLAYVEGSNHKEIAQALELNEKSVRTLLLRVRKKLLTILKKRGYEPPEKRK